MRHGRKHKPQTFRIELRSFKRRSFVGKLISKACVSESVVSISSGLNFEQLVSLLEDGGSNSKQTFLRLFDIQDFYHFMSLFCQYQYQLITLFDFNKLKALKLTRNLLINIKILSQYLTIHLSIQLRNIHHDIKHRKYKVSS